MSIEVTNEDGYVRLINACRIEGLSGQDTGFYELKIRQLEF